MTHIQVQNRNKNVLDMSLNALRLHKHSVLDLFDVCSNHIISILQCTRI